MKALYLAGVLVTLAALSTGCDKAVQGMAVRDPNVPPGKILEKSDLADLTLSADALDSIMGASGLSVSREATDMNDNSSSVSNPSCAGAAYGAQEVMYADSGFTAVRDQTLREPGDNNAHWLEQVVVLFPSSKEAKSFLATAKSKWQDCTGTLVTSDSADHPVQWAVGDVESDDTSITQMSIPDGMSGGCHHSMAVAANVIAEAWACGNNVTDEASSITKAIVDNVDKK